MTEETSKTCSTNGSCGVSGMCPGQALFISLLTGMGLTSVTGIEWLIPAVTIVLVSCQACNIVI